jgi:hypothetical protein
MFVWFLHLSLVFFFRVEIGRRGLSIGEIWQEYLGSALERFEARATLRYKPPQEGGNPAVRPPCSTATFRLVCNARSTTMRRLLIAAALGMGLVSTGIIGGEAFASPLDHTARYHPTQAQPVHYEHRDSIVARHYYRPAPRWHHYVRHDDGHGYRYAHR